MPTTSERALGYPNLTFPPTAVDSLADGLDRCGLIESYESELLLTFPPSTFTDEQSACVSREIVADPNYSWKLSRWMLLRDQPDWLEAVRESFDRALLECPSAYGAITAGAIEHSLGDLGTGGDCLAREFALRASELVGADPTLAAGAIDSAIAACADELGPTALEKIEAIR